MQKLILLTIFSLAIVACEPSNVRSEKEHPQPVIETVQEQDSTTQGVISSALDCEPNCRYQREDLQNPHSLLATRLVYFEFDSDSIPQASEKVLIAHANYLINNPQVVLRVEGHTDERGSRAYNLALSEKRAKSVRRFMQLYGALPKQIEVHAFGEELPMALGSNEQAWRENRRAELVYDNR